jgi:hypothetical protein
MNHLIRWIVAALMGASLAAGIGAFGVMVFAPIAFGTTCLVEWLLVIPILMLAGALAGAVQFGMNKPRARWLGAILVSGALGLLAYGVWFIVASRVCS